MADVTLEDISYWLTLVNKLLSTDMIFLSEEVALELG